MFGVAYVFIHTFAKLILAQVCFEEIDIFDISHVFIDTFEK